MMMHSTETSILDVWVVLGEQTPRLTLLTVMKTTAWVGD
jgi:hypothetical protein